MAVNFFYAPYLPRGASDRLEWAINFRDALPSYASKFAISTEELADVVASVDALEYARVNLVNYTRSFSKGITAFADELDTDASPNLLNWPSFTPPTPPEAVQSGIFARIQSLVETKILPVANEAEKTALRLLPLDSPSTVTPKITDIEALMRGHVSLSFTRGGAKMIFIYSQRGDENQLSLLDKVNDTHYLDERPNLVAGVRESRSYAIEWSLDGRKGDGNLSPITSISTQN